MHAHTHTYTRTHKCSSYLTEDKLQLCYKTCQFISLRNAVAVYNELYEIRKCAGRSKCRVFRRVSIIATTPVKIAFPFRSPVFI